MSNSIVMMYPGKKLPTVALLVALERIHEDIRAERSAQIKRRADAGVPLDDGDGPLVELPPYEPEKRLEGIRVAPKLLSPARRRELEGDYSLALEKSDAAADGKEKQLAVTAIYEARKAYVRESIAEVLGLQDDAGADITLSAAGDGFTTEQLVGLEMVGLIDPLFAVGRRAQNLPLGKG